MNNRLIEILKGKGYEVKEVETIKGGVTLKGINVMVTDRVGCVVYPDRYEGAAEEIAEQIIEAVERAKAGMPNTDHVSKLTDWEWVKDKLTVALRPVVESEHLVKEFLDLQMVVKVQVESDSLVTVTNSLAKGWNVGTDEIFEQAIKNSGDYNVMSISEILADMVPEDEREIVLAMEKPIYVITNKMKWHGAAALLQEDIWHELANKLGADYLYIIPSSVHELMAVDAKVVGRSEVDGMINDVNNTMVEAYEVLSDHVYIYNRETGKITY